MSKSDLDYYAQFYTSKAGREDARFTSRYTYQMIKPYIRGSNVLLFGIGNGHVLSKLLEDSYFVTAIEGSGIVIEPYKEIIERRPIRLIHAIIENYKPDIAYDTVIASHILEHVEDPGAVAIKAYECLAPGGRAIFTVPNADSLHRQIGVKMGIIKHTTDLGKADREIGHRRVFKGDVFITLLQASGFIISFFKGYGLKLTPNIFMRYYEDELLDAIFRVSLEIPGRNYLCSSLMAVCRRGVDIDK